MITRYDLVYKENSQSDLTDAYLEESLNGEYVKFTETIAKIKKLRNEWQEKLGDPNDKHQMGLVDGANGIINELEGETSETKQKRTD